MNLPPFVYAKAFWEALSFVVAGVLGLLVVFGKIPPEWALGSGAILAWFYAILKLLGVTPELRAKVNQAKLERLLAATNKVKK